MSYKSLLIVLFIFLLGCEQNNLNKNAVNQEIMTKYKNSGFALVYNPMLKKEKKISKKIDNRSLLIFHKSLKKNSFVKITNPINQKTVIAEVISNNVKFSDFYNSVITSRIAEELSLNLNEPYINLVLISQNSTFVAKKAKTFEEEKKVAEKAPVDGIQIDNLGEINQLKNEIDTCTGRSQLLILKKLRSENALKVMEFIKHSIRNYIGLHDFLIIYLIDALDSADLIALGIEIPKDSISFESYSNP